jgi:hypothetical protein
LYIFKNHEILDCIGEGVLIPLNKPGKAKTVNNTRPITLLNTKRKALSIILLNRVRPKIDDAIMPSQSGSRPGRSTGDIIWSYRWLNAIAERYNKEFTIMGIDLSKAFDCINRGKILEILRELVTETEFRIFTYLLSNTTLEVTLDGQMGEKFDTTIGTPQGDSLSPILFILYLNNVLEKYKDFMGEMEGYNVETQYVDDCDFITEGENNNVNMHSIFLPPALLEANLKMNPEKQKSPQLIEPTQKSYKPKN